MYSRLFNGKAFRVAMFLSASCLSVAHAFAGGSNKPTEQFSADKQSVIAYWQTYKQSPLNGVHKYSEGDFPFKIEKIPKPSDGFYTGYAFIKDGQIYFEDRGNYIQYRPDGYGGYQKVKLPENDTYISSGMEFKFNYSAGVLSACNLSDTSKCSGIEVKVGTFPYVYASKDGSVLAITNYGDALLFRDGAWCRMSMKDDVYSCSSTDEAPLVKPREIQFYSSLTYQGRVLVGEWPTGRLYDFDGSILKPSDITPPKISEQSAARMGYEAQSMAEYCGDLFVGYWPRGEVWRFDHATKQWALFNRFFSSDSGETFIPYKGRPADHLDPAFFGQRITALVPFEDSLYVSTSNLRSWKSGEKVPESVSSEKANEYGEIYKITRSRCKSTYSDTAR